MSNNDGTSTLTPKDYVAQIGNVKFETLEAAFAAAVDGDTIVVLKDCAGNGIVAPQGKFANGLTVDFGGFTYTVDGNLVGSTGTESQAFQLLKDNKITFKNGTITSAKAKILVQNYSDLTLDGMTLTLNNANYAYAYTLSNNNGDVVIKDTTINANPAGGFAFDVCRYSSYPSVSVTVQGSSVINGNIEVSASGNDPKDGAKLILKGETAVNGELRLYGELATPIGARTIEITKDDTIDLAAPADYKWVSNNNDTSTLTPKDYVAQIGNVKYETLAEAINAAVDGDTITLLKDVEEESNTISKSITLDLNEKTLTGRLTAVAGTVTVDNGTIVGRVDGYDSAKLTIAKDAVINGQLIVWGDGTEGDAGCKTPEVTVNGTITNTGDAAISTNGTDMSGANIIIGATAKITSTDDIAIYLPSGNLTVNGGEITGATAIYQKSGSVTVNGGTITGNGTKTDYSFNGNGANATGDAIVVESCGYPNGAPETAIKGGTIASANGLQVGYYENSDDVEFADVTATDNTLTIPEDYKWVATEPEATYKLTKKDYVAQIGETKYETLEAAFAAAVDGDTITVLKDCAGNGIQVPQGKFTDGLTVDFGGFTYEIDGSLVGSTGTVSQAFQLLRDNNITFKNGTITSAKARMLVQNYSNLTLENMTLDGSSLQGSGVYTLSNNNGTVVIDGSTITAKTGEGNYAFDVCRYATYPSVHVTVKGNSVINGNVEVYASGSDPKDGLGLTLEGGTYTGNIVLDSSVTPIIDETPDLARIIKAKTLNLAAPDGYSWGEYDETHDTLKSNYVAKNVNTGMKYTTLNGALAAARSGQTVVPLTNITDEEYILAMAGVTLDLNGFNVTGATLLYVSGKIVDSGTNRGQFSAAAYYLGQSVGSEFPIYDSASGTYSLYNVGVLQYLPSETPQGVHAFRFSDTEDRVPAGSHILGDANDGRVDAMITLAWNEAEATIEKNIVYNSTMLNRYMENPVRRALSMTFNGLDSVSGAVTATPKFVVYDDAGAVMMIVSGTPWSLK